MLSLHPPITLFKVFIRDYPLHYFYTIPSISILVLHDIYVAHNLRLFPLSGGNGRDDKIGHSVIQHSGDVFDRIFRGNIMKKFILVSLLATLLAGCAHDSPCVPVYDDQGRLVHTNTCMKGTTQDNWETAGAIAGGAAAIAGLTLGIVALTK